MNIKSRLFNLFLPGVVIVETPQEKKIKKSAKRYVKKEIKKANKKIDDLMVGDKINE